MLLKAIKGLCAKASVTNYESIQFKQFRQISDNNGLSNQFKLRNTYGNSPERIHPHFLDALQ